MKYQLEKPVEGSITKKKYQCTIEWRNGKFIADEPFSVGGEDVGPEVIPIIQFAEKIHYPRTDHSSM